MLCIKQTEEYFIFWQYLESVSIWEQIFLIEKRSLGFSITDFPAVLHAYEGSALFLPKQIASKNKEFQINVEKWTIRKGLIIRQNHTVIESSFFPKSNSSSESFDIFFVHPQ